MSTEAQNAAAAQMYGYASDESAGGSPFNFGLNAGAAVLKKFEWIPNGGKDGAEQEALEIIFTINGVDKSYRKFPVTQAYGKNNVVITDPTAPEFKEAVMSLSAVVVHILHCFATGDAVKNALSAKPITSFKQFCTTAASVLPANFNAVKLDIFMQYQWVLREGQKKTYLELPPSMKNGPWLAAAIAPAPNPDGTPAEWKEVRKANPSDNEQNALYYLDGQGNKHKFTRYGKYMNGHLANQQKAEGADAEDAAAANIAKDATAGAAPSNQNPGATAAGW